MRGKLDRASSRGLALTKSQERLLAFAFGVTFVAVMLILAVVVKNPTSYQYTVFRIVLALATAGVAAMIPGFMVAKTSTIIRAGGALAVFAIVYFFSPAGIVKSQQEVELDEPLVISRPDLDTSREWAGMLPQARASAPDRVEVLNITHADALIEPGVLHRRYNKVIIHNVRAVVPIGAVLVANDIEGMGAAGLVGTKFSIVARRLSNLTVDASGEPAGRVDLLVKQVTNSRLLARGNPGAPGANGAAGANGADGAAGQAGKCGGFGRWRKAQPGGDGGNAANGGDGESGGDGRPGGIIVLTAVVSPISTAVDVSGGMPGRGGKGGSAGMPGRGGPGGAGCTGLGGSQSSRSSGRDGLPGLPGRDGTDGQPGTPGEYRLHLIKSFEPIKKLLADTTNEALPAKLAAVSK
ncbi:hypothetical protein JM946_13890 [Steroidobacter sp. S1-65]|uniref:Collagen-like protein n=1 Tax=Steroidobacter gossypii TaxID=2805490 RepID=A0ABS1WY12_9GAMM|nr:hypothetical protein [Steroidobacter gossypii]MBM0105827.1 hypothetical protein [Steroidobacter gossypii]